MSKEYLYSFIVLLVVSNIYFVYSTYLWQNEWLEQFISTTEVESVFKEQKDCLVTFAGLLQGEKSEIYKNAQPHHAALEYGVDQKALLRGDTLLYFKNGDYIGSSKAKLRGKSPWLLKLIQ